MNRNWSQLPTWNPLPLHFMSWPTLKQKNPALHRRRALEAQQNAIALLHAITSEHTEESSVSVVLPMDSEKGCIERQLQKSLEGGGWRSSSFCRKLWAAGNYELWYTNGLFFLHPHTQGLHKFTNLYGWQGFSSLTSDFEFIENNRNIAMEFGVCWLRPIVHREWLSEGDGWACKRKCASNVDYYEVIGLEAIDQNEKSILNGKIMQHAGKGKD